ncbi:MAG: (4Fe-4S)-binding protein [Epulopiscium sp. Nuni2H_MBin003]|nr:MAG: (4Fe-4S)-binding protein [Epulopiscium sp. Nuni2H_MBin003]
MPNYLEYLYKEIHSVVLATTDENNNPITCVIDMMLADKEGLYFLTAKGKALYERLSKNENISLTGFKGDDTMSSKSINIRAKAMEVGSDLLSEIFCKNTYMNDIYPNIESRKSLTVFKIYEGDGEFFDLSVRPIFRESFSFGKQQKKTTGYFITESCIACSKCVMICPQNCIKLENKKASIGQNNCLHCGSCMNVCYSNAIKRVL